MGEPIHHLTVDVEEYFHVSAFERHLPRSEWSRIESRIRRQMDALLTLMGEHHVSGTFFVLGCVAEAHPDLVRDAASGGHEIASHGWDHQRIGALDEDGFRRQVRDSRTLLEELAGPPVAGYRAPSFSITPGREWALRVLVQEGYGYDSSLYPVRRPGYGYPGGERGIHTLRFAEGELVEVPPATLRLAGANLPLGGGGTFRHLPYEATRRAVRSLGRGGQPATLYVHPWEMDPDQPVVAGLPWITRIRHYRGLGRTRERLRRLFGEFRFQPIAETLAARWVKS